MSEHAILFSGEMVRAILEGRKTQTRRVIKDVPEHITHVEYIPSDFDEPFEFRFTRDDHISGFWDKCPYGRTGDRLWVKETFAKFPGGVIYKADYRDGLFGSNIVMLATGEQFPLVWKSSRFMPREASRINLEIVRVRVERLQVITIEDILAEGIPPLACDEDGSEMYEAYADLWDEINAKRGFGWDVNPWVWVIEFKKVV